ncbi:MULTISPECIES: DUF6440 family protein [Caproicibacterium]|uniref:DUF6440 family protein n=1 Tax=Caproicibacterium argilliputei TaxID=3030016 RepID=A0AA97H4G4_9FIRM|nr:DUF6440 family protein [Caproicibacterium argilliputei]WOC33453.1 DUF6440 family protein [Caproicibacterium argilliputei]WOC33456.1 DUF6440 family protein [Caproicibacterium argilliputei]
MKKSLIKVGCIYSNGKGRLRKIVAEGSSVSAAHGKNLAGTDTLTPVTEAQYDGEGHFSGTYYTFYVDNATGVEYIVYQSEVRGGYSTAITPRLNHDGTLVIKK